MIEKMSNMNSLFEIVVIVTILMGMLFLISRITRILYREKTAKWSGKDKIFGLLDVKFSRGLIKDKEDISLLINSVCREYENEYSFAPILEDYLTYLTERNPSKEDSQSDILANYYITIKSMIKQENEEKPFNNIPEEERRLLKSIEDSVKYDDKDAIRFNLQELNTVISTRNRIYQRTDRLNRWSIPVAIIGVILTIIFGTTSLFSRFDYKKIEDINKELLQNQERKESQKYDELKNESEKSLNDKK